MLITIQEQDALMAHWKRRPEGHNYRQRARNILNPGERCRKLEFVDKAPGYIFTPAHSTWVIGKIMWEMLTLRDRDSLNDEIAQLTEQDYWGELGEEAIPEIKTKRKSEYSPELRGLIRDV
jgi:hypothetical protein